MTLPRFRSGQPLGQALSARMFNELARATEQKTIAGRVEQPPSPVVATVKNTGTSPISVYHPCGIGECLNDHPDGLEVSVLPLLFEAVEPTTDIPWGVTQSSIGPGDTGPVLLVGMTWAYIGGRPSGSSYGGPSVGFGPLEASASGRFQILSSEVTGTTRLYPGVMIPQAVTTCARRFVLFVAGNPSGGTFTLRVTKTGSAAQTLIFNYDDSQAEVISKLATYSGGLLPSSITIDGPGDLPNNNMVITVPSNVTIAALLDSATNLTRQGVNIPSVRVDLCCS